MTSIGCVRKQADPPRRGRQAEAAGNDRRLLDAARDVFAARGEAATVSAIAERAGVGIGSLYRRYGSKEDLLRQLCTLAIEQTIDAAKEGLQADDPWTGLVSYIRACVTQRTGSLAPLAGTIVATPQMWATARRGRRSLDQLVARAHEGGRLRTDVTPLDIAWLIELFGRFDPLDKDSIVRERLLALAIDGLSTSSQSGPLPGPAPGTRHYERRWGSK